MSRSARLLALLQELRCRRRPVTAAALARELQVSERTIYRDLSELAAQGGRSGAPRAADAAHHNRWLTSADDGRIELADVLRLWTSSL